MKDRIDDILHRVQAEYLEELLPARDPLLEAIEKFAEDHDHPIADPEVAQLMRVLMRLKKPRRIVEVGTNIGYSVVVMGRELDGDAVIETIEVDRSILETARRFATDAALPCRVVFHEGAATEVLPRLDGPFDFAFIDCVKTEYGQYLDQLLPKLERGALIMCDNLLWKGKIARGEHDASTDALRDFNRRITTDPRLLTTVVPVGDGTGLSVVL
jgi:predicted O-methyltransferase YrrM